MIEAVEWSELERRKYVRERIERLNAELNERARECVRVGSAAWKAHDEGDHNLADLYASQYRRAFADLQVAIAKGPGQDAMINASAWSEAEAKALDAVKTIYCWDRSRGKT